MRRRSEFDIGPLIAKIRQIPGLLEREMTPLVYQQSRLFVKEVVAWSPPASQGTLGTKAKKQGEAAIARDIYSIYGTVADAYESIKEIDPAAASAFWFLHLEGNYTEARTILHMFGNRQLRNVASFAAFDGGAIHRRFRNKRGTITRTRAVMIVTDQRALAAYVKKMQGRVGLLANGWNAAAAKLGVRLPVWVSRHGTGNGSIAVEAGNGRLVILISNKVRYGLAVDMQRRANYVLRYRQAALKRRLPYVLRAALKKSRLGTGMLALAA